MFPQTQSAAEMLGEIESETAAELVNSILHDSSPPGSTGLLALDILLQKNQAGISEAGAFEQNEEPTSSHNPPKPLNRGDVIEIQGPATSGKTQLLYHLVMQCILPKSITFASQDTQEITIHVGGWERAAVIFDTDIRWDVRRLHSMISARLVSALGPSTPNNTGTTTNIKKQTKASLARLHVFRPRSSTALAATLMQLPEYLSRLGSDLSHVSSSSTRTPPVSIADLELGLLAIDSISAFYWEDRYALELEQRFTGLSVASSSASGVPNANLNPSNQQRPVNGSRALDRTLIALQNIRKTHGPVIVLTNWALNLARPFTDTNLHQYTAPMRTNLNTINQSSDDIPSGDPQAGMNTTGMMSFTNANTNDETPSADTVFYHQHLHPFPAPFDHPPRVLPHAALYPPITHHISLQPPPQVELKRADPFDISHSGTGDLEVNDTSQKVVAVVRTVQSRAIGSFTFLINDDGIQ